jgi:hypothetical protein
MMAYVGLVRNETRQTLNVSFSSRIRSWSLNGLRE